MMEDNDFFVMLNMQDGGCGVTPLTEFNSDKLAMFNTEEAARKAAKSSVLGDAFGYEVFERGYGC